MSEQYDDGGQAYPSEQGHIPDGTWNQTYDPGKTLADEFAGQAMVRTSTGRPRSLWHWLRWAVGAKYVSCSYEPIDAARRAYEQADAMISEKRRREAARTTNGQETADAPAQDDS